eukprot:gene20208-22184_t
MTLDDEANNKKRIFIWISLSSLTLLLNLVEVVILARRHSSLKPYEKLLLSLAFSDLLVAIYVLNVKIYDYLIDHEYLLKETFAIRLVFSMFISISNSFAIAIDRLLAVKYPIKHRIWMTNRRMNVIIIILWLVCLIIMAIESVIIVFCPDMRNYYTYRLSVCLLANGVLMTIFYTYIFKLSTSQPSGMYHARATNGTNNRSGSFYRPWSDKEKRIFYTCFLVTFSYVICSYPFSIEFLIVKDADKVSLTTRLILFLNSAINPVIYFFKGYGERKKPTAANNIACISMHSMAA